MNIFMRPGVAEVLQSLRPLAEWTAQESYESIIWHDTVQTKPTKEEFDAELLRLNQWYDSIEYQRQRAREYPSWQDQMDLLYHGGYDGWKTAVDAVKNKYPKPE